MKSASEELLAWQIKVASLPVPERQFKFCPGRRYQADFAWPSKKLLVEVQGGLYRGGRHNRPVGYQADCWRMNIGTILGWRWLYVTPKDVESGKALKFIEDALL